MSASEKLRSKGIRHGSTMWTSYAAKREITAALPQIVAVVEAAEKLPKYAGESTEMLAPVHVALAALDEVLS